MGNKDLCDVVKLPKEFGSLTESSVVIKPFVLTESDDTFEPPLIAKVGDKFMPNRNEHIGMHSCGGRFILVELSPTHWRILCDKCGKAFEPPKSVDGYENLQQWCADEIRRRADEKIRVEMLWRSRCEQIEDLPVIAGFSAVSRASIKP